MKMPMFKLMLTCVGIYVFLGGLLNWPWLRIFPNSQELMRRMGAGVPRLLFIIFGLGTAIVGILALLGIIPME